MKFQEIHIERPVGTGL